MAKTIPTIGSAIRARRVAAGHSQQALASRANLAVNTLARIERGKQAPGYATLERLALALGLRIANLLPG